VNDVPRDDPVVLIIEDERHLADLYADYAPVECSVPTAYSGEEGLDRITHFQTSYRAID
jgi:DNA-binding response OmpR family regulator